MNIIVAYKMGHTQSSSWCVFIPRNLLIEHHRTDLAFLDSDMLLPTICI